MRVSAWLSAWECVRRVCEHMWLCVCVCVHVYMPAHVRASVRACVRAHVCSRVRLWACVPIKCVCACGCADIYARGCVRVHVHNMCQCMLR